jgi:hypothetical protein
LLNPNDLHVAELWVELGSQLMPELAVRCRSKHVEALGGRRRRGTVKRPDVVRRPDKARDLQVEPWIPSVIWEPGGEPYVAIPGHRHEVRRAATLGDCNVDYVTRRLPRSWCAINQAEGWPIAIPTSRLIYSAICQTTVGKVESGSRPVRLGEALACADLFGLTIDEMLEDPDSPEARDRRSRDLRARRHELDIVAQMLRERAEELEHLRRLVEATPDPSSEPPDSDQDVPAFGTPAIDPNYRWSRHPGGDFDDAPTGPVLDAPSREHREET